MASFECEKLHGAVAIQVDMLNRENRRETQLDLGAFRAETTTRLEVLERRYIEKVLARVDHNKTAAAQVLGISERTVRRVLDRFDERTETMRKELT